MARKVERPANRNEAFDCAAAGVQSSAATSTHEDIEVSEPQGVVLRELGRAPTERISGRYVSGRFTAARGDTVFGPFTSTRADSTNSSERRGRMEERRDARGKLATDGSGEYPDHHPPQAAEAVRGGVNRPIPEGSRRKGTAKAVTSGERDPRSLERGCRKSGGIEGGRRRSAAPWCSSETGGT